MLDKKFFRSLATFLFCKKNLHIKGMYSFLGWKGEVDRERKELLSRKSEIISNNIDFDDYFTFVTKQLPKEKHPWFFSLVIFTLTV